MCGLALMAMVASVPAGNMVPPGVRVGVPTVAREAVRCTHQVTRTAGSPASTMAAVPASAQSGRPRNSLAAQTLPTTATATPPQMASARPSRMRPTDAI